MASNRMSAAAGAFSAAAAYAEPSCGMLWLMLATLALYLVLQLRSVLLFHVGLMSLVFIAVQSNAATVCVALSYSCFFVSLDDKPW